ncbi:hypothetical protein BsWGS_02670 [Bradybaena similaris]
MFWGYFVLSQLFLVVVAKDCPKGEFGWHCKLKCENCEGEECDPDTGRCLTTCKSGYYGHHCLFNNDCMYDSQGIHYSGKKSVTDNNTQCIEWNKVLSVDSGSSFENGDEPNNFCRNPLLPKLGRLNRLWCYVSVEKGFGFCDVSFCGCPANLFGDGCVKQCHCKLPDEVCDQNGVCKSGCADGWTGIQCQKPCETSKYGHLCQKVCDNCLNKDCDHETGQCRQGCVAGYMGSTCQTACTGNYGINCSRPCGKCKGGHACDSKTGHCRSGCEPGFKSSSHYPWLCDTQCKYKYGDNCGNNCGACYRGKPCDVVTGICSGGCQDGYTNDRCNSSCPSFYYGKDCAKRCGICKDNSSCDPFTGRCVMGCGDGHIGFECIEQIVIESETSSFVIWAGVAGAVGFAVIILVVACIVYKKRKLKNLQALKNKSVDQGENTLIRDESVHLLSDSRIGSEPPSSARDEDDTYRNNIHEPIYMNVNNRKQTSPVPVSELYDYIAKNKEHNCQGFMKEFEELPMGLLALCDVARRQENKVKNRYGNIVAYDHSRVILDPLPNEPHSDYVNANFMDGYSRPKMYIASQGPNKVMIRDFWRMVWQQKVSKIVMLTNLMEACKKKCEQYWPDEGSQKYGDLTVLLVNTTKYTDFVIRTFELMKEMENSRIVKQFHFTTWSDHGAPTYPTTLLSFRRKVLNFKPEDTAPILSHCSAGIGRTGTFIALNCLLEQAAAENVVDVLRCAQLMRANRVNMIQTLEQYVFVYDAVLEAIMTGNTTIPRSSFHSTYEEMLSHEDGEKSEMEKQHEVLQRLSPTIEREECSVSLQDENMSKNRFKNILPANRSRPYLYTPVDGCNDYINAVYLSGYTQKDQFLVTQMPLPTTVADFWRMLYDTTSDTIVMLNEFDRNDKSCALYWPEEYGYTVEHGSLSVELLSSSEADIDVTVRVFKLSHLDKGEERAIKQFMFKSWPDYQTMPNSVSPLLRLYHMVNDWLRQNSKGPVTVHCMNGASKSGVFVAMCLLLERLELDYEVDVYQTVKQIRINRPQFIENLEQYKFLHQIVQEYMDQE